MAQPTAKGIAVNCPACGARFTLQTAPKVDQVMECPSCEATLVVVGLDPVELEWVFYDDEFDGDDDDMDFDEDDEYAFDDDDEEDDDEYAYDDEYDE